MGAQVGVYGNFGPGGVVVYSQDEYFTPEQFGAAGNGIRNDAAEINLAIIAAEHAKGKVYFSAEDYRVDAPVIVNHNGISLEGNGHTRITGYGAINILELGAGGGTFHGLVKDLMLVPGDATVLRGIYAQAAHFYTYYNVYVIGAFVTAGVEFRKCYCTDWYGGEVLYSAANGIYLNPVDGDSNNMNFFGPRLLDNIGAGIHDGGGAGRIYDVYCETNQRALWIENVIGFSIRGYFEDNLLGEIRCVASHGGHLGGVYMRGATNAGHMYVALLDCSDVSVDGIYFSMTVANYGCGVYVNGLYDNGISIKSVYLNLGGGVIGWLVGGPGLRTKTISSLVLPGYQSINGKGINYEIDGSVIPAAGSARAGDICHHSDVAALGTPGWICTHSGTFGGASDNTGDTTDGSSTITGMTSTIAFNVGDYVDVSAGFPATGPFLIIDKSATSITLDVAANATVANVTVDTSDPVWSAMPSLV